MNVQCVVIGLAICLFLVGCGGNDSSRAPVSAGDPIVEEPLATLDDSIHEQNSSPVTVPTLSCTPESGLTRPEAGQIGMPPSGGISTSFLCEEHIPQAPYLPGGEGVVKALDAAAQNPAATEKIALVQILSTDHHNNVTEHYYEIDGVVQRGNSGLFIDEPTTIEATVVVEDMPVGNSLFVAVAGPNPDDPRGYTIDYQSHPQVSDGNSVAATVTYDFNMDSAYADGKNFHIVAFRHDNTTGELYSIGMSNPIRLNLVMLPRAAPEIAYNGQQIYEKAYHEVVVFGYEMPVAGHACMFFRDGGRDTPYQDRSLISVSNLGEFDKGEDLPLLRGKTVVGEHPAYFVEVRIARDESCHEDRPTPTQAVTFVEVGRNVRL